MDISYTNVLEGARQYFQGLPAATNASGSPAISTSITDASHQRHYHQNHHQHHHPQQQPPPPPVPATSRPPTSKLTGSQPRTTPYNDGSVRSEQHSAVPVYWDQQNEGQAAANLTNAALAMDAHLVQPHPARHASPAAFKSNYAISNGAPPKPGAGKMHAHMYAPPPHQQVGAANSYYELQPGSASKAFNPPASPANGGKMYSYAGAAPHSYHAYQASTSSSAASTSSHQDATHRNYKMYSTTTPTTAQQYPASYYPTVDITGTPPQSRYLPVQQTNALYPQGGRGGSNNAAGANMNISATSSYNGSLQTSNPYYTSASYKGATPTFTTTSTTPSTGTYVHPGRKNYSPIPIKSVQQAPVPPTSSAHNLARLPLMKAKRESPLDLSVKTVRTSADSTLADHDDRHAKPYVNFDERVPQVARQHVSTGAPKVDFLPNFTMQKEAPASSPRQAPRPSRPNHYYNYPYATSSPLPKVDFDFQQRKRSLDYANAAPPLEKRPKTEDAWRQTIDRQIEQRINSYTKTHMTNPNQMRNGNVLNTNFHPVQQQQQHHHHQQQQQSPALNKHYSYPMSNSYQAPGKKVEKPQATKKVLTLLRTSLQNKGAKSTTSSKTTPEILQNYREVLQPSTDVLAPLQPKPGIVGRRNASPFTAASLERNSNTPPMYKFHIPKAIDSVIISDGEKDTEATVGNQASTDLDGLAAFIAARIRTKAELKQVTSSELGGNNNGFSCVAPALHKEPSATTALPPTVITSAAMTPKKLFGRSELKRSEVRSSSETSIFDFPDSDTEEMPVLERQSLLEMRKDRKPPKPTSTDADALESPSSPFSLLFQQTCDIFVDQLKYGCGKKRGRRKKESCTLSESEIKVEVIDNDDTKHDDLDGRPETPPVKESAEDDVVVEATPGKKREPVEVNKHSDSDSDTPLVNILTKQKKFTRKDPSRKLDQVKASKKTQRAPGDKEGASSDSEVETLSRSQKNDFYDQLKAQITICKPGKKPTFGDGSDFRPGWEEALYRYKKSIRIPMQLIQVTRPPSSQRLSTSLPDLDPCPISPAPKLEGLDSDLDSSNCSFNFMKANYDSDQGSMKSFSSKSSILDKLLERYGGRRRKRPKKDDLPGPKTIPKSESELLPTPNLDVKDIIAARSTTTATILGFRKKTVEHFKDAFMQNGNRIPENFKAIVMKARTRTENRVLKEKATIREVFGEDRPASAPPVTCVDELKPDEPAKTGKENKLNNEFNDVLLKALESKKLEIDAESIKKEEDDNVTIISNSDSVETVSRRKNKLRRKGSSGFDYIRKKKKQTKKEDQDDIPGKNKRRHFVSKATPSSIDDIQKEVKQWVLNKGVGETHLHRASRAGLTDITAYCLEKMACNPSPKDNAGYTPLHEACSKGHLDIARLLLEYGAHVSDSAQGGIRPLHEAAENGYVEIVRLLLSYGADPTLATYSGLTPLQLASDNVTIALLEQHLDELQGKACAPWRFPGPAKFFDGDYIGYDPLADVPPADDLTDCDELDIEFEVSEQLLPNLYILPDCDPVDRWVLLQDLSNALKIKSKETLLRQLNIASPTKSELVVEMKMVDFLEKAHCCQFMNANEKLNTRATKLFLVKYTDKVKRLLNVENISFTSEEVKR